MTQKIIIDIDLVEKLAALGDTMEEIASSLGISAATLYNRKRYDQEIRDAIKRGKIRGIRQIENVIFKAAAEGNLTAAIFYLKNRAPDKWNVKPKDDNIEPFKPYM